MKKAILYTFLAALGAQTANAQEINTVIGTRMRDNWSIGVQGGVVSPFAHHAFWGDARGAFGLTISKDFTPVYGLSFESNWGVNTSSWSTCKTGGVKSRTVLDYGDAMLLNRVNVKNMFGAWSGHPAVFDVEAVAGVGWLRYMYNEEAGSDYNTVAVKAGLNLNFNLGKKKAWTFALKPAVVWDALGREGESGMTEAYHLNGDRTAIELMAGLVYHFGSGNGQHYQTRTRAYDADEVARLNATISNLNDENTAMRGTLETTNRQLTDANAEIERLKRALTATEKRPTATAPALETVIAFRQGSSKIDRAQQPAVERLAEYLKANPNVKIEVAGYASPEGSAAFNNRLAQLRADAVKSRLVTRYGIDADRIKAVGHGVGTVFGTPAWNRVSICEIK